MPSEAFGCASPFWAVHGQALGGLAGVAPHVRGSGQWTGNTFVQGARRPLRDAFYMPALVAARFPHLKAEYAELRACAGSWNPPPP